MSDDDPKDLTIEFAGVTDAEAHGIGAAGEADLLGGYAKTCHQ